MKIPWWTATLLLPALLVPHTVFGHGVDLHALAGSDSVQCVLCQYSTAEPMPYAKVKLFAPSQPELEVLQGTADRNGRFCFMADESGRWRLEAEDGMGHKGSLALNCNLSAPLAVTGAPATGDSLAGKTTLPATVLGLSLIFNIFILLWLWGRRRKAGKADAH